jgi:hypothetical protein
MHRVYVPAIVFILLLAAGLGSAPTPGAAQDATPGAASPEPTTVQTFCSPEEIARGEHALALPLGDNEGIIRPAPASPDDPFPPTLTDQDPQSLYIGVLTLPPDACIDFRERTGAVILFVQEGSIAYTAREADTPEVVITQGDSDGQSIDNIDVELGTVVALRAGDWLTQDRPVEFSFRNTGGEDAVISMAIFAAVAAVDERCQGGCIGRP